MSTLDNVSALLDSNLDDLADLPAWEIPPAGAYHATILAVTEKQIGTHPAVEFKFRFDSTMELANPGDIPVKDGTESSVSCMLDNEFGIGALKEMLKPIKAALGTNTTRETMEAAKGLTVMLVTKVRSGKGDAADKKYLSITKLEVL
jgi:hypothetical protein